MRKLVYSMMVSLDGFINDSSGSLEWATIDEELHTFSNDQAREAGAFVYGRRLYEAMTDYWPTAESDPSIPPYMVDFARIWKDKPKVVVSTTLDNVGWNSRLVRDNLAEEITRLKSQPGGFLELGGAMLAAKCIELGLVDEFQPIVHPVVLGGGTPYLPAVRSAIGLRLIETRRFRSGVVYLRYERAGD